MRFSEHIRAEREAAGLGVRELARMIGYSAPYQSRLETGDEKRPPSEHWIKKFCDATGADFDETMSLAGRIPADVEDYLVSNLHAALFVREVLMPARLSPRQMRALIEAAKKEAE